MSKLRSALALVTLLSLLATTAEARNNRIAGNTELSGGIGFAADLARWTPGGFKWFNEFGYKLSRITWLNFQLNLVAGGGRGNCYFDNKGRYRCDNGWNRFGGTALEFAGGVKLKWRVSRAAPVQLHAKFGGAMNLIWFGNFAGVAIGFRGGIGLRYFVIPTLGVGAELMTTLGPSFIKDDFNGNGGVEFYGAIDMNFGVEWRF